MPFLPYVTYVHLTALKHLIGSPVYQFIDPLSPRFNPVLRISLRDWIEFSSFWCIADSKGIYHLQDPVQQPSRSFEYYQVNYCGSGKSSAVILYNVMQSNACVRWLEFNAINLESKKLWVRNAWIITSYKSRKWIIWHKIRN